MRDMGHYLDKYSKRLSEVGKLCCYIQPNDKKADEMNNPDVGEHILSLYFGLNKAWDEQLT